MSYVNVIEVQKLKVCYKPERKIIFYFKNKKNLWIISGLEI